MWTSVLIYFTNRVENILSILSIIEIFIPNTVPFLQYLPYENIQVSSTNIWKNVLWIIINLL